MRDTLTSVAVIAPVRLYREGLADVLARHPKLEVVGIGCGVDDGVARIGERVPEVVVLDVSLPESVAAIRRILEIAPATRIVALAVPEADDAVIACAEAGVSGCITRDASLAEVVEAVLGAARGEAPCSPGAVATLLRRVADVAAVGPAHPDTELTLRELEIAELLELGLSNKEIAARLFIEVATVKNHVHHVLEKLQVSRRTDVRVIQRSRSLQAGI